MQYWDGSQWVIIPAPSPLPVAPKMLTLNFCNNAPTWNTTCDPLPGTGPTYKIGDTGPAGGIVFYIIGDGSHGMEAAPVDQASSAPFGCYRQTISGATNIGIGTGAANTAAIIAFCNETGIAAKVAAAYSLNSFNDWYLPSADELNEMYFAIGPGSAAPLTNIAGFHSNTPQWGVNGSGYWSSTQLLGFNNYAYAENFYDGFRYGNEYGDGVGDNIWVRAIRSF